MSTTPTDERFDPAGAERDLARRGLGALVRTGVRWKVVSSVVVQATRTVTAVVIARLVTPEQFGLAALVLVFSTLAINLTDLSLGAALVQRKTISDADRSTAFWTSAGMGCLLTLVFLALSWPLARFYDEPSVQPLLALYSTTFLLNGLATTQATLLSRDLHFRSLELRIIVATLVAAPVGIVLAALGAGAWAIVLQALAYSVVSLPLLWVASPWRPSFVYSLRSLRDLGGFGANVLGAQIVRFVSRTADTVLIGRFLGSASVGAYSIAMNLTRIPLYRVVAPVQSIAFPAFARVQGDREALADGWLRATSLVALLVAPASLGMVVVAPDFVHVVLGERWLDAIPVIQALSWVALLSSLQQLGVVSVLLALDRSGTSLRITVATTAANVVAFVAGLPWGIVGVAVAYAAVTTLVTPVAILIVQRAVGSPTRAYVRHVLPPLAAAGIMAACVLVLRLAMPADLLPAAARLVILVAAGAASYLVLAVWLVPDAVGEVRRLLPARHRQLAAAPSESVQLD
jgi:O-antigen/teichoic acid export membrane protein